MTCTGKYAKLIGSTAKWGYHKSLLPQAPHASSKQTTNSFMISKYFQKSKQVPACTDAFFS